MGPLPWGPHHIGGSGWLSFLQVQLSSYSQSHRASVSWLSSLGCLLSWVWWPATWFGILDICFLWVLAGHSLDTAWGKVGVGVVSFRNFVDGALIVLALV